MKKLVVGILAHVDAGKTTLAESMLYLSGKIKELGRVDHKDAHLDTHALERERGITIFAEQALCQVADTDLPLLDTPGHVDFSAEMERTLHVLDYAVLVISGVDGVQAHTKTLWRLLELYNIPVFIFVNKMDRFGTDRQRLLSELRSQLHPSCVEFSPERTYQFLEELAGCDLELMEHFFQHHTIETDQISQAVGERRLFPCFYGSALTLAGVEEFLNGLVTYAAPPTYPNEFGAEVFKVSRDEQGNRLTHLKIVGGSLRVRDALQGEDWEEKVNEIRLYSGQRYTTVNEVGPGSVCAVTGLSQAKPGEGIGIGTGSGASFLEPVLSYQLVLPDGTNPLEILPKLRELEEEQPELHLVWNEALQEIQAQLMGEVQLEILESLIASRFGLNVRFGAGKILYRETIASRVEGVGHYEPLRHYAEVQLLLTPGEPGSGLKFDSIVSEDVLAGNWQRLILTHLQEKTHLGVLTGSPITDMKITLVGGRASLSHTQGGDFRQATYRAVRQGLKEAKSVLLEPYYSFQLEVPEKMVGRAIHDLERMHASYQIQAANGETSVLVGSGPVVTLRYYPQEVIAYTKGTGRIFLSFDGYRPCHNAEEVIAQIGYDSEQDMDNPTGSIFFANGRGFYVTWDRVKAFMHLPRYLEPEPEREQEQRPVQPRRVSSRDLDEIDYELLERTVSANRGKKRKWVSKPRDTEGTTEPRQPKEIRQSYLLVDGYNIIHAWPELKQYATENMDTARLRLIQALANYQGVTRHNVVVVFDAHLVEGQEEKVEDHHGLKVVFTKEAQTADQYIEKIAYANRGKHLITVATSDHLQQIIIRGAGCALWSAEELRQELARIQAELSQYYGDGARPQAAPVGEALSQDELKDLDDLKSEE